jgi:hypothetical protein
MKFFRIIALCLLVAGFISCTKQHNEAPPDLGYDYYPAKVGSYIVYDVDSISYRQPKNDTVKFKFQIKEKIDTLFYDNQGRPTVKIIRYKKMYNPAVPYSQMNWTVLQDVWMANKTKTDVEVVEENIRYTKLPFPVKLNSIWNGTAHADTVECDYKCTAFDVSSSYGNLSFQKTLTVSQANVSTAINFQNYNEKYARGVGLIYKEITDYQYKQDPVLGALTGQIYEGIHYVMTINMYGVE